MNLSLIVFIKEHGERCPEEEFFECDVFIYMLNGFNQRSSQVFTQLSSVANSSSSLSSKIREGAK